MLAVGLTGGIGSGKSTVAEIMEGRGALLIDADKVAREVVEPSGSAYDPLVERFGRRILSEDGTIDRKALAALAFADPKALEVLNSITHPAIGIVMVERRRQAEGTDRVVLLDIPLLRPVHRQVLSLDSVVVVDCPVDIAIERLVDQRGFDRADAEARVSSQIGRDERIAGAEFVIDNSSDLAHLRSQTLEVWEDLNRMERDKETSR